MVKIAARNTRPSTRPWSRLCEDTSIAAPRAPRSTSAASVACRSIGPGVVRFPASLGTDEPAGSNAPRVPIEPVGSRADSTWRASVTDVVFPLVPVTPTRSSLAAGVPYHAAAKLDLVGVTGTNGKTTSVTLARHVLSALEPTGSIGTLGAFDPAGSSVPSEAGNLTTPGPIDLQATLAALVERGARGAAMEGSSHSLDQGRGGGPGVRPPVLTNLAPGHLDHPQQ